MKSVWMFIVIVLLLISFLMYVLDWGGYIKTTSKEDNFAHKSNFVNQYLRQNKQECLKHLPSFQEDVIWKHENVQEFNNCYSYSFRDLRQNLTQKPQPGFRNSEPPLSTSQYTCPNFVERLKRDYPLLQGSTKESLCPCGYHKIFLALDNQGYFRDYHFWRQDIDGTWSHKPGTSQPLQVDAKGKPILDPEKSNRFFYPYDYSLSCGFFCVPSSLDE